MRGNLFGILAALAVVGAVLWIAVAILTFAGTVATTLKGGM